ncbi:amino acid adenylation domain-containing protein [Candidatus Gracilibacteria bacterium]|nr:amino acid adenylation domain-containing protein [Candidatus Gracilibacteria bacterium]NJM89800.1 amino acid adenylation domain-containing protein [Hydrococcus sp. RU_2_2]
MQKQLYGFKLSPQQRRLWLLQKDAQVYQSYCAILLEGNLDKKVLRENLDRVVNRHEILRTTFRSTRGIKTPVQVINEGVSLSIYEYSLEKQETLEQALEKLLQSARQQIFEWEQASLLYLALVTISPQKHILFICLPALCADLQSLNYIVDELSKCYAASIKGEQVAIEPMQYAEVAEWQNQFLHTEESEAETDFWRKLNISNLADLRLPSSNQQTGSGKFSPQCFTIELAPNLLAKIDTIIQKINTTNQVFFLTCWQTLLSRLTENLDLIVGVAGNSRNDYEELQESIGLLVKYLPFYSHLENNQAFKDRLAQVAEVVEEIFEFQEYFDWEKINVPLNENRVKHLFFPFCFEFEDILAKYHAGDVCFSIYKQYSCVDRFHVKLSCVRRGNELVTELFYDANIFNLEDIQCLAERFETLLANVVENPEGEIASFNILGPNERSRLLVDFNNTKTVAPKYQCIHHWFESQCDRTPNNIAVVCGTRQLTYSELNAQANQLANYLKQKGVRAEVLVGICVERSHLMAIGVLGILKAGGAYLPLDPTYPKDRLAFILDDTQVDILLTQEKLLEILPKHNAELLFLDKDCKKFAQESPQNLGSEINYDNLAYVIYTSGSTGKPKGTLITHQGLINYLTWCTKAYAVDLGEGTPVHSSLAFDLTITGLFSPLMVGRRVELLPEDPSIESLCNALRQGSNYSLVKITPAQLLLLSQQLLPTEVEGRTRAFIIGGENLLAESISFWQEFAPDTLLVNEYGPTETVVGCCIYQVAKDEKLSGSVPIGHPIANTELYVLDRYYQPVPTEVSGELYIGGAGLARGYLNRPELTAEKFIPNPFSNDPGARLYRTGDLVRFRADGNLEFLGRIDNQVKIRGFRIELGEIEGLLLQYPGIQETLVTVREDVPGDKRLVSYIVLDRNVSCSPNDLQSFLKKQLPNYMVPSAFVMMDALPLTPNGKVDRRALPAPDEINTHLEATFVAANTLVEEMLAGIWAQILGLEQVSIHDNFFDLGGHSLLATQLIYLVQKNFQVELSPRCLFESPTVSGFAEYIKKAINAGHQLNDLPIQPVSRDTELPLSFGQQRLWIIDRLEPESAAYNGSNVILIEGQLNLVALKQSINEVIRRHEVLRTSFVVVEGNPVQNIAPFLEVPLTLVDLQNLPESQCQAEVRRHEKVSVQQPFDLTQPPLLRLILLQLNPDRYILIVTIHHIISDAWSAGIFIREISALYEAFIEGRVSPLPALPIQYADFAVWQQQWLQPDVLNTRLNYWKRQLEGANTVLDLPTDKPRSQVQSSVGAKYSFAISAQVSDQLKKLSRQEGITLFMTLLAVFDVLLYYYTGQEDILIGSPIANRDRSEINNLIGFFLNTIVLRNDLSNNPSFRELLQRIREVALEAYAHQDLPFEKLVAQLQPERYRDRSPLFQVWFVLQNTPKFALKLPELNLSILEPESVAVRHDLKLDLTETSAGIEGFFEYKTDLFYNSTIERMATIFKILLDVVVEQPELKLNQLVELIREAERETKKNEDEKLKQKQSQQIGKIKRKAIAGNVQ